MAASCSGANAGCGRGCAVSGCKYGHQLRIRPYGRILGSIPLGESGALDLVVPEAIPPPIFARFGNAGFFCLLILMFVSAAWVDLKYSMRQ